MEKFGNLNNKPKEEEVIDESKRSFLRQAVAGGLVGAGLASAADNVEAAASVTFGNNWTGIFGKIKLTSKLSGQMHKTKDSFIFNLDNGKTCSVNRINLRMTGECDGVTADAWNNEDIAIPGGPSITFGK